MNVTVSLKPLVDYSSDETSDEDNSNTKFISLNHSTNMKSAPSDEAFQTTQLPIPCEIKQMFHGSSCDYKDDPADHGGKIRSFPHERGVWATYVYIPYKTDHMFLDMAQQLQLIASKSNINLEVQDDFHISLSRTLKLRHHWISPFVETLRENLVNFTKFSLRLQSLEIFENDDHTRTFLGITVAPCDYLLQLLKRVDSSLSEFKLPLFYQKPSFHLSCASCVGSKAKDIEKFITDLELAFQTFIDNQSECRNLLVKEICCKTGNKVFTVSLKS